MLKTNYFIRGQIYKCTNANRKENLERSEIKKRKEKTLCRHGKNPIDQ